MLLYTEQRNNIRSVYLIVKSRECIQYYRTTCQEGNTIRDEKIKKENRKSNYPKGKCAYCATGSCGGLTLLVSYLYRYKYVY